MPIVTTNFIAGRMNKSVDERLLPPGEYIDAINVRLGSTESTEMGAVENSKGNTKLTTLEYGGAALSSDAVCIGAFDDSQAETMYWFVHDPANPILDGIVDMVVSYNVNTNLLNYHVITLNTLAFNPKYLITGVDKIEDLLFFTDGLNSPKRINVKDNYPFPTGIVDGTIEEDLSVILNPPGFEPAVGSNIPLTAPTIALLLLPGGENYIQDRFTSFAYRYRYENNEYSATSLFTLASFQPGNFNFNPITYTNDGMSNQFNGVRIGFSTGSERVIQVDLLYKDSNTNSIYVIERFKKDDYGWANDTNQEYVFSNSKIYSVIGSDELLRQYDNVPLLAKAQTIMGNRLMYGNYVDGYDIVNSRKQKIAIDYSTALNSIPLDFKRLPAGVFSTGENYTINPNTTTTVVNSVCTFNLSSINTLLKEGATIDFNVRIEHSSLNGTTTTTCYLANTAFKSDDTNLTFQITLTANYVDVYDFSISADFINAIGTILNTNFQPIATADQGNSLTDKFNAALVPPSTSCTFSKLNSSITNSTTQQGFNIISTPGSTSIGLQVIAMQYRSTDNAQTTDMYEYFRFSSASVTFSNSFDKSTLHSNRDYETGIVYMDGSARASTVLVSEYNTIFVPASNSVNKNKIKATVNNYAPEWAKKYKFVVKPSKTLYETIYSNFFYVRPSDNVVFFKLEGDNQQKVRTGDTLFVKRDISGAMTSVVTTTVLDVTAEARDFLATAGELGDDTFQLPGLYMQLKADNFNINISENSVVGYGEYEVENGSRKDDVPSSFNVAYPCFTAVETAPGVFTTTNYTLPAGSQITIKVSLSRIDNNIPGLACTELDWGWNQTYIVSQEYTNFLEWWLGDNIDPTLSSPGNIVGTGDWTVINQSQVNDPDVAFSGFNGTSINNASLLPSGGENTINFGFVQANVGVATSALYFAVKSNMRACFNPIVQNLAIAKVELIVQRSNDLLIFETEPADANEDIYYDASEAYDVLYDATTENYFHQSGTDTENGDQNQSATQPAVVNLSFMDAYSFGNGAESYKYLDRIAGKGVVMGQRGLSVSEQDFKRANRFADITYSGVYSSNSGINNLNEFNLGLVNFKTLETSFGPIQLMHARETDILVLQEDRISYVLASKNIISDAQGGGAIVTSPVILGNQISRIEEYGVSFNPESFAHYGAYFYFTDTKRSAVIQLAGASVNDKLSVISDTGMRSWFRDQWGLQLNTQKIGGYDPYMDEYVLGTNTIDIPTPPVIYQCGVELNYSDINTATSATFNFGTLIGQGAINYSVVGAGSIIINVLWNGVNTTSGPLTGGGSFAWNKTAQTPQTAVITITPSQKSTFSYQPECIPEAPLTVVKCVINSSIDNGEYIHPEYSWLDSTANSPVSSSLATLGSDPNIFSLYDSQVGVRSQGVFPYSGVDMTIRINKVNFDTYNWGFPEDNFRILSSSVLYQNNATDVAALLAAATKISNNNVTNPATGLFQTVVSSFSIPASNPYLYLIYDLRDLGVQQLCYDANAPVDACCACTWGCTSFVASRSSTNAADVCQLIPENVYYHNGTATYPIVGSIVYTTSQCENLESGGGQTLPSGYYRLNSTPSSYIRIGIGGLVLEVTAC